MAKMSLTDIHTHILPSIDDGAANLDEALTLLKQQKQLGVDRVVLTPHFRLEEQSLEKFLKKREDAFNILMASFDPSCMPELSLGAEIKFSPDIINLDLKKLTLCNGDYILLELDDLVYPPHIRAIVSELSFLGFIPVLAHVERCLYFRKTPYLLADLISKGALAHVTAENITAKYDKGFCRAALNKGYAHIVASDTHDLVHRRPNLARKLDTIPKDLSQNAEYIARCIWDNETVFPCQCEKIVKRFGRYY